MIKTNDYIKAELLSWDPNDTKSLKSLINEMGVPQFFEELGEHPYPKVMNEIDDIDTDQYTCIYQMEHISEAPVFGHERDTS